MKNQIRVIVLMLVSSIALGACATWVETPKSLGERNSGFSYVPLDPLPVYSSKAANSCTENPTWEHKQLLQALPDIATRMAVLQREGSANLAVGPVHVGSSGNLYQVVLDYISVDATNIKFEMIKRAVADQTKVISIYEKTDYPTRITAIRLADNAAASQGGEVVSIPVYVGVGLRLTATVSVLKGKVDLGSLGVIAAEAQAGNVTGSLVVQTLGVTGKQVVATVPLPSELNATTIQNAILALGAIKAIIYSTDGDVVTTPRVTGIYNAIGGGPEFVNAVVSELAKTPIEWKRPCEKKIGT